MDTAAAAKPTVAVAAQPISITAAVVADLQKNLDHPLSHLFVQLLVIIAACRLMGVLFTKFGQPAVVGEMTLLSPVTASSAITFVFSLKKRAKSQSSIKRNADKNVCITSRNDKRPLTNEDSGSQKPRR